MDRQRLMAYIEDKGNARKQAMHKVTQLQTDDWHNTNAAKRKMVEQVNRLKAEQQQWEQEQQQQAAELQNENNAIRQKEQLLEQK